MTEIELPIKESVLAIHDAVIDVYGGSPGVSNGHYIDSAINRPLSYIAYNEYTLHTICAVILDSLARYHSFIDGNKRTSILIMLYTYRINGVDLAYSLVMNKDFEDLVLWVVEFKPEIGEIESRLVELAEKYESTV